MVTGDSVSEEFKLTLSGDGLEVQRSVTPQQAASILSIIMGGDLFPTVGLASNSSVASAGPVVRLSLREFLDEVGANKKSDQIVAIGHYMSLHEGEASFTREQVKERFKVAREPMPANLPRDFGTALNAGLIAEDHKVPGQYYITKSGLRAIESRFDLSKK
ncbi:hypothetical protein IFT59_06440 [Rhizobium sp. CFBP 8752]|uniref:hypothetical protein n=1 Tax=Rhizobium sp. CFBP 8752 TaxID=2775301 RepID=UPI00177F6FCC|nr:hypothetical protein [Rhizobium sp. CFBP 8752]MBD8662886.1 hypothetical protein [Rhizobium sp. CFBP 8752]